MSITFTAYDVTIGEDDVAVASFIDGAPEANFSNANAWTVGTKLLGSIGEEMDYSGGISDLVDLHTLRGVCQQEGYAQLMGPHGARYRLLGDVLDYCIENCYEFGWG